MTNADWVVIVGTAALTAMALVALRIALWNGIRYAAYGRQVLGTLGGWLLLNLVLMRCLILAGVVSTETTLLVNSLGATSCALILVQIIGAVTVLSRYHKRIEGKEA